MAQDEDENVFKSYIVEREDFKDFWDPNIRVQILSAMKGTGKSALCRLAEHKIRKYRPEDICIRRLDSDISPRIHAGDDSKETWVLEWKRNIINAIAVEIGTRKGIAWTDDEMTLVEQARKTGHRPFSLLASIFDRLDIPAAKVKQKVPDRNITEATINRNTTKGARIWLILDEVDQFFDTTRVQQNKITSFFVACSELSRCMPELVFRLTVRPNVWTFILRRESSLAGLQRSIRVLWWSESELEVLLARRIEAYLIRTKQIDNRIKHLSTDRIEWLHKQVFEGDFDLGSGSRPPHVVLCTLSGLRPRWLIELCKIAAQTAKSTGNCTINQKSLLSSMTQFGFERMSYLAAEYSSQCSTLDEVMRAFSNTSTNFGNTHNLCNFIEKNVLQNIHIALDADLHKVRAIDVANLLYFIGFVHARIDALGGDYKHTYYDERPDLLKNENLAFADNIHKWEIHPMFRNALFLKHGEYMGELYNRRIADDRRNDNHVHKRGKRRSH